VPVTPYAGTVFRRGFASGGAELVLGVIWLATSVVGVASGRTSAPALLADLAAFAALVVVTRRTRPGIVLMTGALLGSLLLDPTTYGVVPVLSSIAIISLLRAREHTIAAVHTLVTVAVGVSVSLRAGRQPVEAVFIWLTSATIAWVIGLAYAGYAELSADRERQRHQRARMELAWDLHDFVARDLTIISMRADAAIGRGGATVEELQQIARHSRSAAEFLRGTAGRFGSEAARILTLEDSLEAGKRDLATLGRALRVTGTLPQPDFLPGAVGGRVLREALHNATKHGQGDVSVTIADDGSHFTLEVANIVLHTTPSPRGAKLGMTAMRHRAEAVGGEVTTHLRGGEWVTRIRLPKRDGASARGDKK
jgi:signal transduction histidine kinase